MTEEQLRAQAEAEAAAAAQEGAAPAQEGATQTEGVAPAAPVVNDDPLRGQKLTINGQEVDASEYLRSRLVQVADEERRRQYELEQKKLERRRLGEDIGEFSAVIGDMIKASNGALVTPRDFRQIYNSLDTRQQQLFDREMARRDALAQQEAARKEREAERIQQQLNFNAKLEADKSKADQLDDFRRWKTEQDNAARVKAAQVRAQASVTVKKLGDGNKVRTVPFSGTNYDIPESAFDGRMGQLYAYLDRNNLFPTESGANDDLKSIAFLLGSGNSSNAPESSKQKVATACLVAIHALAGNREHEDNIIAILQGTYGRRQATSAQTTQTTPVHGGHAGGGNGNRTKVNW